MTDINDLLFSEIANDLANGKQVPSGQLSSVLQAVVQAQDYRTKYLQVFESGVAVAGVSVAFTVRIRFGVRVMVERVAYVNQQVADTTRVFTSIDRLNKPSFAMRFGAATVAPAAFSQIVGEMAISKDIVVDDQMPGPFVVPSDGELRFDAFAPAGTFTAGAQQVFVFAREMPQERDWQRFKAQTVLIT